VTGRNGQFRTRAERSVAAGHDPRRFAQADLPEATPTPRGEGGPPTFRYGRIYRTPTRRPLIAP